MGAFCVGCYQMGCSALGTFDQPQAHVMWSFGSFGRLPAALCGRRPARTDGLLSLSEWWHLIACLVHSVAP